MSEKYMNISVKFQKIDIHSDTGLHNDLTETIKVLLGVQLFLIVRYISVCARRDSAQLYRQFCARRSISILIAIIHSMHDNSI